MIIKHLNPCGFATGATLAQALAAAWEGDPVSAYGSVIAVTRKVDLATAELLKGYDAIILAEPNNPYSKAECDLIVDFVKNGGGLFIVGDHGNADRDGDGWDAVRALNEFCPKFGFKFK